MTLHSEIAQFKLEYIGRFAIDLENPTTALLKSADISLIKTHFGSFSRHTEGFTIYCVYSFLSVSEFKADISLEN
jgi:hypothetical protein